MQFPEKPYKSQTEAEFCQFSSVIENAISFILFVYSIQKCLYLALKMPFYYLFIFLIIYFCPCLSVENVSQVNKLKGE